MKIMLVKTFWYGAQFIPENEDDKKMIDKMLEWKQIESYEGGGWEKQSDGSLILDR
jgi:hypothetical protein